MGQTNREGLTFEEFRAAANYGRSDPWSDLTLRRAWRAGEDPTEYAAASGASRTLSESMVPWSWTDDRALDAFMAAEAESSVQRGRVGPLLVGVVGLGLLGAAAYYTFARPAAAVPSGAPPRAPAPAPGKPPLAAAAPARVPTPAQVAPRAFSPPAAGGVDEAARASAMTQVDIARLQAQQTTASPIVGAGGSAQAGVGAGSGAPGDAVIAEGTAQAS
jgi:hypothetical protein